MKYLLVKNYVVFCVAGGETTARRDVERALSDAGGGGDMDQRAATRIVRCHAQKINQKQIIAPINFLRSEEAHFWLQN